MTWPGGDERIRTFDILLAKQALSQLSYTPIRPETYWRSISWEGRIHSQANESLPTIDLYEHTRGYVRCPPFDGRCPVKFPSRRIASARADLFDQIPTMSNNSP